MVMRKLCLAPMTCTQQAPADVLPRQSARIVILTSLSCCVSLSVPLAGRLSVKMTHIGARPSSGKLSTPPPDSWQQHIAPGRWLAKHSRLCRSIEFNITPDSPPTALPPRPSMHSSTECSPVDCSLLEASIAAGLTLAAHSPSSMLGALHHQQLTVHHETSVSYLYPTDAASAAAATHRKFWVS